MRCLSPSSFKQTTQLVAVQLESVKQVPELIIELSSIKTI